MADLVADVVMESVRPDLTGLVSCTAMVLELVTGQAQDLVADAALVLALARPDLTGLDVVMESVRPDLTGQGPVAWVPPAAVEMVPGAVLA